MNYKEKLSLKEIRKIQLNGLIYLKDICEKYNITYYITSGTLLGAVKYKGYIPWDDDIDIALKRDDYLKLIKLLEKENNSDYKVLTIYNTKDYYYPYAKLTYNKTKILDNAKEIKELGVFVDIFPLDYFDDNITKFFHKTRFIRNMISKRMKIKNDIKKTKLLKEKKYTVNHYKLKKCIYDFIDIISRPLGYNFWAKLLDKILLNFKSDKYIAVFYLKDLNYFDVDLFNHLSEYKFENHVFTSIKDYDKYLTQLYGNYRKDPPLSKQKTHHQIVAYWRNNEK